MFKESAERKATREGYSFTGVFSKDKEKMKECAKKERADGYLAIVVNVPPNPLSRGYHRMGYSVYRKPTEKKAIQLTEEKAAKEKKFADDLVTTKNWLGERSAEELFEIVGNLLHKDNDFGNKEEKIVSWAKRMDIVSK